MFCVNNVINNVERSNNLDICLCLEGIRLTLQNILALSFIELSYSVLLGIGFYSKPLLGITNQLINKQTKTLNKKNHILSLFHTAHIEKKKNKKLPGYNTRSIRDIILEFPLDLQRNTCYLEDTQQIINFGKKISYIF